MEGDRLETPSDVFQSQALGDGVGGGKGSEGAELVGGGEHYRDRKRPKAGVMENGQIHQDSTRLPSHVRCVFKGCLSGGRQGRDASPSPRSQLRPIRYQEADSPSVTCFRTLLNKSKLTTPPKLI